jgi:hypothetical protein
MGLGCREEGERLGAERASMFFFFFATEGTRGDPTQIENKEKKLTTEHIIDISGPSNRVREEQLLECLCEGPVIIRFCFLGVVAAKSSRGDGGLISTCVQFPALPYFGGAVQKERIKINRQLEGDS